MKRTFMLHIIWIQLNLRPSCLPHLQCVHIHSCALKSDIILSFQFRKMQHVNKGRADSDSRIQAFNPL